MAGQFSGVLGLSERNWELGRCQFGSKGLSSVSVFFGDLTGTTACVFCELQGVLIHEFGDLILAAGSPRLAPGKSIRDVVVWIEPGDQDRKRPRKLEAFLGLGTSSERFLI